MEIKEILEEAGLSEKEATVYLSLLQLGEGTASRISEIAEQNRITTYSLLKSLQEKGFCSIFEKNNVQYFKPIKPEQILNLLEEKKNKIKTIIPLLKEKEGSISEKPEISLFEGKKGISSLLDTILKDAEKNKEVLVYGNFGVSEKVLEYQSLHWRKTRLEKRIKIKAVVDKIDEEFKEQKGWSELSETKLNKNLSKFSIYTMITENIIAYLVLKGELSGVLIKSKELAQKERFNFDLLWNK